MSAHNDLFFQAIKNHPLSASLILGKMVNTDRHDALNQIQEKVTPQMVAKIVLAIQSMPEDQRQKLDPEAVNHLKKLCHFFVKEKRWAKKCSQKSLLALGKDENLVRWVLYRLLEQHNSKSIALPCELLDKFGSIHSASLVAIYYKNFAHLPLNALTRLAQSEEIAHILLSDLAAHPNRFELSRLLIEKYPHLAKSICAQWKNQLKTQPRPKDERIHLLRTAQRLSRKHPEFKSLLEVKTRKRTVKHVLPTAPFNYHKFIAGTWVALNLPAATSVTHSINLAVRGIAPAMTASSISTIGLSALMVSTKILMPFALYKGYQYWHQKPHEPILNPQKIGKQSNSKKHPHQ